MYRILGADEKEYGPVSADQIRQWIVEHRLNAQSRVQAEGSSEWRPLSAFPEFASLLLPPTAYPLAGAVSRPRTVLGSTNGLAITGLVLGIISVTCGLFCCGFMFGVPGIICSGVALSQISKEPEQKGRGLAMAGLVLSILGLIGGLIVSLVFGVMSSAKDIFRGFDM